MTRPSPTRRLRGPARLPAASWRTLTAVLDCRGPALVADDGAPTLPARVVSVADLLDPLTAAGLAMLRRANREAILLGRAHFRCPGCLDPVYPAVRSVIEAGTAGGTRAFFKHHARRGHKRPCPLAGERGTSQDAVDALRFDGRQEGAWHFATKETLANHLDGEPGVRAVFVETPVHHGEAWRQPDLLVSLEEGYVAIEVQGASPQLDVILSRQAHYTKADVGLLWVVDAEDLARLERQGFQDLYWPAGGVIFGWSAQAEAASHAAGRLQLHRLRVTEQDGHLDVEDRLVSFTEVVSEVRACLAQGPWPLAQDALARAYRAALLAGDDEAERVAFERLRAEVGLAATWEQACDDRVGAAVAAAITAITGKKAIRSRFPWDAPATAILNNWLGAPAYRAWVPVVLAVCEGHPRADALLVRPSTTRLVETAWAACQANPERTRQLRQRWGAFVRADVKRCYAISKALPAAGQRLSQPYASVSFSADGGANPQLYVRLSSPRRVGSAVILRIDEKSFQLVGREVHAWARNSLADAAILAAMRTGVALSVETRSDRGARVRDRYLLRGAASAVDSAALACAGLRR